MNRWEEFDLFASRLEHSSYRFAKTMKDIPHYYTLRKNWRDSEFVSTNEDLQEFKNAVDYRQGDSVLDIAIISDGDSGDDIILTTKGIVRVTKIKPYKSDYSSAKWARNGKDAICISSGIFNTNRPYNNNDVKMENLLSLFKELSEIRKSAGLELQNDDPCYVLLKGIE